MALRSDAVLIAIRAAGPDLVELALAPPLQASARFGLVTLSARTPAPGLALVREWMRQTLRDAEAVPG